MNKIEELRSQAIKILAELTDQTPCKYDHHGYCQTHSLHSRPCPHERAKQLLFRFGYLQQSVVIHVRSSGGTHIARAQGLGITASSTYGYESAARACADKVFCYAAYSLDRYGRAYTWIASPKSNESRLMICPKHLTCDRNDDGIGQHCARHAEIEGCGCGSDGCPPCVPVDSNDVRKGSMKITAIHGGGDWYDASADYLILPDGMDFEAEKSARGKWYRNEYLPALRRGENPKFVSMVDWLRERWAIEPTDEQLTVVSDD